LVDIKTNNEIKDGKETEWEEANEQREGKN
jgi:hypothetical protein